jgi:hypothetical protein
LTRTDDGQRLAEAGEIFDRKGKPRGAEGFEVWDGRVFFIAVLKLIRNPALRECPKCCRVS